jgi:hypothetical protein
MSLLACNDATSHPLRRANACHTPTTFRSYNGGARRRPRRREPLTITMMAVDPDLLDLAQALARMNASRAVDDLKKKAQHCENSHIRPVQQSAAE